MQGPTAHNSCSMGFKVDNDHWQVTFLILQLLRVINTRASLFVNYQVNADIIARYTGYMASNQ